MPNCTKPIANQKCGEACTQGGQAYLKDCKSGNIYYGKTYAEVRAKAQKRLQVEASGKLFPGVRRIHPISKLKTVPTVKGTGSVGLGPSGKITVPAGSRFDNKPNNWKDTEKLLGDPEPDDDPGTVGGFDNDCFGLPMECGSMAVIGGAVLILILLLRRL